jgi:hypothetical protein
VEASRIWADRRGKEQTIQEGKEKEMMQIQLHQCEHYYTVGVVDNTKAHPIEGTNEYHAKRNYQQIK